MFILHQKVTGLVVSQRQASGNVSSKVFQMSLQAVPNTLGGKVHSKRPHGIGVGLAMEAK